MSFSDDDLLAGMDDDLGDLGDVDGFNLDGSFFLEDGAENDAEEEGNFLSNMLAERATELNTIKEPTRTKSIRVSDALSTMSFRRIAEASSDQAVAIATLKKRTMDIGSSVADDDEPMVDPLAETNRRDCEGDEVIEDDDFLDVDRARRKLNIIVGAWLRVYRERINGALIPDVVGEFVTIEAASSYTFPEPDTHPTVDGLSQILKDTERLQQGRLRKIRQLLQDGEKGVADGVFKISLTTPATSVDPTGGSINPANPEVSRINQELDALQSSSSIDFSEDFKVDEDETKQESDAEVARKTEKATRKAERRGKRTELRGQLTQLARGGTPGFNGTSTGITRTLEVLGLGGNSYSIDGLIYKIVASIKLVHDDILQAYSKASDASSYIDGHTRTSVMERSGFSGSVADVIPVKALRFGHKSDELGGGIDSIVSQGFELALLFVGACDDLPSDEFALPEETHDVLQHTLRQWRAAYPLTAFFSLKMVIASNARQALPYCAAVLKHADAFQSKTVEMAMVCVAEEAIDGTLRECALWITPVLAVLRMLARTTSGVNEDLLTLALDVLMFAVVGEGNAATQFIREGGMSVLASVLLVIEPNDIKPEVVKRVLKLLNPASLGVPKAACLEKAPKRERSIPSSTHETPHITTAVSPSGTPGRVRSTTFLFPEDGEKEDVSKSPIVTASETSQELTQAPSMFSTSVLEGTSARILFEDDYDEIINAVIIALDKYDGLDTHRNAQAQRQAHDDKVATQKRQYEAAAQQAKSTTQEKRGSEKLQNMRSIVVSPQQSSATFVPPPPLPPPASADNQVLEECTFIIYSIINADPDYAVRKSIMQTLCRHVIGSDIFWNSRETLKGVLACLQQYLVAFHAISDPPEPVGFTPSTKKMQGEMDLFGKVTRIADDPNTAAYYRSIMDAPTLATLALALRCFAMDDVSTVQQLGLVYKMLYVLVAAEPSRSLLVQGCRDDDELSMSNSGRLGRRKSLADYVSVGLSRNASRRTSLQPSGSIAFMPNKDVPPHNALIPCILHCLTRTPFGDQKRLCVTLLNRVCKGAFKPACTQLLGILPLDTLFSAKAPPRGRSRASSVTATMAASIMPDNNPEPSSPNTLLPGAPQPCWLGGVSSGAVSTRCEPPGAFLRYLAKFIGTATPELVPALLALIREIGRFLSGPSNGDVFDQIHIQNILSSVLSILSNFSQEAAVVAGSCMTLAHLCRIPHPVHAPPSKGEHSGVLDEIKPPSRPSSASFRPIGLAGRLNTSEPTPTLTYAFENDILDTAVGLIGAVYIQHGVSRRVSIASDPTGESIGPSPIVKRTLGFLLAVLAIDMEAIPTIVEEGGLPLIADAGGVAKSMGISQHVVPTSSTRSMRRTNSVGKKEDAYPIANGGFLTIVNHINRTGSMRAGVSTRPGGDHHSLASILTREEKDFCRRQAKRIVQSKEKSGQTPVDLKLKRVSSGSDIHKHQSIAAVTSLLTNQVMNVQLDFATSVEQIKEQERDQRQIIREQRTDSARHIDELHRRVEESRKTHRQQLQERYMELRSETVEYERDSFMSIMQYASRSLMKRSQSVSYTPHQQRHASMAPSDISNTNIQEILGAIAKMQEQQMKLQSEMMMQSNQQMIALAHQPLIPHPPAHHQDRPLSATSLRSSSPTGLAWCRQNNRPSSSSLTRGARSPMNDDQSDANQHLIRYVEHARRSSSTAGHYTTRDCPDLFDYSLTSRCATPGQTLSSEAADKRRQYILRRSGSSRPPTAPTRMLDRADYDREVHDLDDPTHREDKVSIENRMRRLHQLVANARSNELPDILMDRSIIDPSHITVLDFSRNYLGDGGLRELMPVLKGGMPNLRRVCLRHNGLTGAVLHDLLLEVFGIPPPPPSEVMWSSPRPVAGRTTVHDIDSLHSSPRRRQHRLHKRVSDTLQTSNASDPTNEVAEAVVQFLLFLRDDVIETVHTKRLNDPSAPVSTEPISVMLPAGHVLVEGVALLLPILEMERLLNAALEDIIHAHNQQVETSIPPDEERRVSIPRTTISFVLPGGDTVAPEVNGEDPGWQRTFVFSGDAPPCPYKKIESLDISHNPGIAPRSNRALLTYLRHNPYLMHRSPDVDVPPRPTSAIQVLRAKELKDGGLVTTPRSGAKESSGSPLLVEGTQLFHSTTTLIQQIAEQRSFRMGLLYERIRQQFTEALTA